jgi:hypothetical protein
MPARAHHEPGRFVEVRPRRHDEPHQRRHAHAGQGLVGAPHKPQQQLQDAAEQGWGRWGRAWQASAPDGGADVTAESLKPTTGLCSTQEPPKPASPVVTLVCTSHQPPRLMPGLPKKPGQPLARRPLNLSRRRAHL